MHYANRSGAMERIAIPIWMGRVTPVLDTAERLWLYDHDQQHPQEPRIVDVGPGDIWRRAEVIRQLGIRTLLCGALSRPLHNVLLGAGIVVWPWLSGAVEDVLSAYLEGRLDGDRFCLPGCRRRGRCGRPAGSGRGRGFGRRNKEQT